MKWVIQENLFNERNYDELIRTIKKMDIDHVVVKMIPFVHTLEPEIEIKENVVCYGSTGLTKIAMKRGWTPGVFFNPETFKNSLCLKHWGEHMLNSDAEFVKFGDIRFNSGYRFIRPDDDLKAFNGMVVYHEEFAEWKEKVLRYKGEIDQLNDQTPCIVSTPKKILREYRVFIVAGKAVTGSIYKMGENVISDPAVEDFIYEFAEERAKEFSPADAFVIDIAFTEGNVLKVIEVNCLNSSGFYASDVSKILQSVNDYCYEKYSK